MAGFQSGCGGWGQGGGEGQVGWQPLQWSDSLENGGPWRGDSGLHCMRVPDQNGVSQV